ncbi:hypothetical protein R1flu_027217 [Riccia fluitans]|uniref:Complex III subunit 9 n=1 Tax=Riccia fluitans TaxID=41844 RepID=A0ABD1XI75_9MARC
MASAGRVPGGFLDSAYRLLMRRNSVYVTFIFAGAIVGERIVDYTINKVWDMNNVGKRFEDIPNLGSKVESAEE